MDRTECQWCELPVPPRIAEKDHRLEVTIDGLMARGKGEEEASERAQHEQRPKAEISKLPPTDQISLTPAFVNKVLFEHSHAHLFTHSL